jgi:hypothetical protein
VATLTIMDYEAREDLLPSVCLKCGDPATDRIEKRFSWYPRWVIVLILFNILVMAIVAMVLTKRMTVKAPLCQKHRSIWRKVTAISLGTFLAIVAACVLMTIVGQRIEDIRGWRGWSVVVIFMGWILGLVVWLIVVAAVTRMSVYATSITDDRITLAGVSERFVEALDGEREEAARADRLERDQRRRRSNEDLADEPLPPRRSRPDDRIRG